MQLILADLPLLTCDSVFHQVRRALQFQFEFGALGEVQFVAADA